MPLLALTARADADAEPASREAGMAAFLRKPVSGATLVATVESLVG
jgi:DNA-binding response OmpR family regulator